MRASGVWAVDIYRHKRYQAPFQDFFFFLVGLVPVPDLDGGAGWERLGLIED